MDHGSSWQAEYRPRYMAPRVCMGKWKGGFRLIAVSHCTWEGTAFSWIVFPGLQV